MLRKINRILSIRNSIFLFAVYFSFYSAFGSFHKHQEENLHFHAENLLTKDHTVAVTKDCSLCEAIVHSTNYIFEPAKYSFFIIREYAKSLPNKFHLFSLESFRPHSGRSPPDLKLLINF